MGDTRLASWSTEWGALNTNFKEQSQGGSCLMGALPLRLAPVPSWLPVGTLSHLLYSWVNSDDYAYQGKTPTKAHFPLFQRLDKIHLK